MLTASIREELYERAGEDQMEVYSIFSLTLANSYGDQWSYHLGETTKEKVEHELENLELALASGLTVEIAEDSGFQQTSEVVYGSPAYAADWRYQEYLRMDEEEQFHYHRRFG